MFKKINLRAFIVFKKNDWVALCVLIIILLTLTKILNLPIITFNLKIMRKKNNIGGN